jgi:hypothetical protein
MKGQVIRDGRAGFKDGNRFDFMQLDAVSLGLIVNTFPHHEIHEGNAYVVHQVNDLTINQVLDIQITTPATTKWCHTVFHFEVENETQVFLYEDIPISTAGTAHTSQNRNRNSSNTAGVLVAEIVNASVNDANSDTDATDSAVETILEQFVGAGQRETGSGTTRLEYVLKQNTEYSLRFIATAAGFVNWMIDWYEHTSKY